VWSDLGRLQFADHQWADAERSFDRAAALDTTGDIRGPPRRTPKRPRQRRRREDERDLSAQNAQMKATHLHLGLILTKEKSAIDSRRSGFRRAGFRKSREGSLHAPSAANGGSRVDRSLALPDWAAPAKSLKVGDGPGGGDKKRLRDLPALPD